MAAQREKRAGRNEPAPGTTAAPSPTQRPWSASPLALALAMIVVALAVLVTHWPTLSAQALGFDDGQYVLNNLLVQNPSWASVRQFFSEVLKPSTVWGYYQPLAMISLMLDWAGGGRADNLRPFHRTALTLHVLNTLLVTTLLYVLFRNAWVAALVGLLFGLHPMTVEPIAWTGERKTLLATFFVLGCLTIYVLYTRRRNPLLYAVAIVAFLLALLAKPTATPLPVLLLLLDWWPLRRLSWRAALEKVPFFVLAAAAAAITIVSQGRSGTIEVPTEARAAIDAPLIIAHNIVFYMAKFVWPAPLTPYYPIPEPLSAVNGAVLAGLVGTLLLIAVVLVALRWTRGPLVGALFFVLAILPTMGIIGFTNTLTADKYAYLPLVGVYMALAGGAAWLWPRDRTVRGVLCVAAMAVAGLWAGLARHQITLWRDTETLYRHMLVFAPNVFELNSMLGARLVLQGRPTDGEPYLRKALAASPNDGETHNNLGRALFEQGRTADALAEFSEAVRLAPQFALARANLGRALVSAGRLDEARPQYEEALRLDPKAAEVHNSLGILFAKQGQWEAAEEQFRTALRINPDLANAHISLGQLLVARGRAAEAVSVLEAAQRRFPEDERIRTDLERARAKLGAPGGP